MSTYFFYTLFYCLISGCIIYPPVEFVSTGLTIKTIFANWLGSETESFINYHIRRSVLTLFVHSLLPFGKLNFSNKYKCNQFYFFLYYCIIM